MRKLGPIFPWWRDDVIYCIRKKGYTSILSPVFWPKVSDIFGVSDTMWNVSHSPDPECFPRTGDCINYIFYWSFIYLYQFYANKNTHRLKKRLRRWNRRCFSVPIHNLGNANPGQITRIYSGNKNIYLNIPPTKFEALRKVYGE